MKKYLASRAILISTAHNESNIIIGRSLRHNETIRVRLTASSSLLRLSVLPLQISLEKIPLRSCNLLFKAEIYKKKKKGKKNIWNQTLIKFNINKSEKVRKFCKKKNSVSRYQKIHWSNLHYINLSRTAMRYRNLNFPPSNSSTLRYPVDGKSLLYFSQVKSEV